MPIAIYRLNKLSVATSALAYPNVLRNHSRRQLRDVRMTQPYGQRPLIRVFFTEFERRHGLLMHYDEEWCIRNGDLTVIHRTLRNGRLIAETSHPSERGYTQAWTQQRVDDWVWERFEKEQTSQCIIEQYLHTHTPVPENHRILTFDFNPPKDTDTKIWFNVHPVRSLEEALATADTDRSEDSNIWANMFLSA